MKNRFNRMGTTLLGAMCLLSTCGITNSCSDDNILEKHGPSFLGASIYDELKNNGQFKTEVRLIDDLGYSNVLAKTGSKTLFVADDEAFAKFFQTTTWKDGSGNPIRKYEQLSTNQKRLLLNGQTLNNAYVVEMMSNTSGKEGAGRNMALRQGTNASVLDSIPYWHWYELPENLNVPEDNGDGTTSGDVRFWDNYRKQSRGGIYMTVGNTNPMMTHFLEGQMRDQRIKHSDVTFILNLPEGSWKESAQGGEARSYVYNRKITKADVTCMNGYYDVLDSVLVTPSNMAEVIRTNGNTKLFSELLDRFSAPYYDAQLTHEYSSLHKSLNIDSVFTKRYIANNTATGKLQIGPDKKTLTNFPALNYDPAWNTYAISSTTKKENDMAAMFVPSDQAMKDYFLRGAGKVLMKRYAKKPNTEENLAYNLYQIPLDVIQVLINNLMKDSFNQTVPSKYMTIMNDAQDQMFPTDTYPNVEAYEKLIDGCLLANNGVIYVMNTVISPADYASVIAPALLSRNTQVVKTVIRADEPFIEGTLYNKAPLKQYFTTYLKAMQSRFSFFVPTDDGLKKYGYVDPMSLASGIVSYNRYWKYEYSRVTAPGNEPRISIKASAYKYNVMTGQTDQDSPATGFPVSLPNELLTEGWGPTKRQLLTEMINQHIIVHDNSTGISGPRKYYISREGAPIYIKKLVTADNGKGMEVEGGYQLDLNSDQYPSNDNVSTVTAGYDMTRETNGYGNGMTYLIDRPMQPTMKSVFKVLSSNEKFKKFFDLCNYFDEDLLIKAGFKDSIIGKKDEANLWNAEEDKFTIFTKKGSYNPASGQMLVRFFNNYRYTVYVPTNEAMDKAIAQGLPTWESISSFISSHADSSGKLSNENKEKAQAMITCLINFLKYHFQDQSFYLDDVSSSGEYQTASYDQKTGAYIFLRMQQTPDNISVTDESGHTSHVIAPYNVLARDMNFNDKPENITRCRYIKNSSYAVIHQIDGTLNFVKGFSGNYNQLWSNGIKARRFVAEYRLKK